MLSCTRDACINRDMKEREIEICRKFDSCCKCISHQVEDSCCMPRESGHLSQRGVSPYDDLVL